MKRFHVHISVDSIEQSTQFYNTLFGQPPAVSKSDYAKWMLDDPRINFAISKRGATAGLDHLGLQLESADELHAMTAQFQNAGLAVSDEGETTCCYAKSDKGWVHDPQGIAWESFVTMGEATTYGVEETTSADSATGACCAPSAASAVLATSASAASCTPSAPKISLADIAVKPVSAAASCCGTGAVTTAVPAGLSDAVAHAPQSSAKACC